MKQHIFKWVCVSILLVSLIPCQYTAAQTDYNVPITFSVTQTGMNRFIASQWSSITTSWSGTYQGLTYSFQLVKPSIVLSTNTIQIILGLNITSSVYNGSVQFTPTLTIPSTTISLSNIIAQYTNLRQQIDAITQFTDVRLKDVIEQKLAPIDWIVYQGKVLDATTTAMRSPRSTLKSR
jgi:hypothetical protein